MPSDKKRVNLTIPDDIYERLQAYKQKHGINNDATACYQLIVQQLDAQVHHETIFKVLQGLSVEKLAQISTEGLNVVKSELPASQIGTAGGGPQGPASS